MKKANKLIALSLAGAVVFSMPVFAAPSQTVDTLVTESSSSSETYNTGGDSYAHEIEDPGIPMAVVIAAEGENKTASEYMNNAVAEVPGLEDTTPVAQGGHVIINGAPSNQTFSVMKPYLAEVNSAKTQANALGGKVLNVARIQATACSFNTATVNFYMPGVAAGNNIQVYQLVDGKWNSLNVAEIREDHVVVDMTSTGTLAFIEVAAQ